MKKILAIAFISSLLTTAASAQEFYFRLGAGYALPQAGQTMDGTGQPYNGTLSSNTNNYSIKSASFTAGTHLFAGLGYLFTDHVGIELNASVGISNKQYSFYDRDVSVGGIQSNVTIVQNAVTPVMLMPSLLLQTGGDVWNIYTRFGPALPLLTKITQDQVIANAPGTGTIITDDFTLTIKNSFSVGFAAAAGLQYKINDRMCVWGEMSLLSMSVYIKSAELVSASQNGQSVNLSYVSGPKVVNYSKSVTVDSNFANQPTYSQPFSNIGINVGVSFKLAKPRHSRHSRGMSSDDPIMNRKRF